MKELIPLVLLGLYLMGCIVVFGHAMNNKRCLESICVVVMMPPFFLLSTPLYVSWEMQNKVDE
ncbi:MAG: hypothetical protein SFW66_08980 [Gammaproteobacteria bacterium]|nr:hypothetical protein [Gammaproteobacteria bacterium]